MNTIKEMQAQADNLRKEIKCAAADLRFQRDELALLRVEIQRAQAAKRTERVARQEAELAKKQEKLAKREANRQAKVK